MLVRISPRSSFILAPELSVPIRATRSLTQGDRTKPKGIWEKYYPETTRKSFPINALLNAQGRLRLVVDTMATPADGYAEREAAAQMLAGVARSGRRITVGADKAYDMHGFARTCRRLRVTPHVACTVRRSGGSAIDVRTTRPAGYAVSQKSANALSRALAGAGRSGHCARRWCTDRPESIRCSR